MGVSRKINALDSYDGPQRHGEFKDWKMDVWNYVGEEKCQIIHKRSIGFVI